MSYKRHTIGRMGFFYDEVVRNENPDGTPFPSHVEVLRTSLLDFHLAITLPKVVDGDPAYAAARDAVEEADLLVEGHYNETRWQDFFKTKFFNPLSDNISVKKDDPRRTVETPGPDLNYDSCTYSWTGTGPSSNIPLSSSNQDWNMFHFKRMEKIPEQFDGFRPQKCPRPDYAFYLPIYHLKNDTKVPRIKDSKARKWNETSDNTMSELFSWDCLQALGKNGTGLQFSPMREQTATRGKAQKKNNNNKNEREPKDAFLNSYPWLLIEHKKDRQVRENVESQACNGSACALCLNQIAARYAIPLPEEAHIPPIPVVTTIGPNVKVWVAYFGTHVRAPGRESEEEDAKWRYRRRAYFMRAIWEGDMTKLTDSINFRIILENAHTWAMRVFKPLMASYITAWKRTFSAPGEAEAAAAALHQQRAVASSRKVTPMVESILSTQPNVSMSSDEEVAITPMLLSLLVEQICVSEREALALQIDHLVSKRLEPLYEKLGIETRARSEVTQGTTGGEPREESQIWETTLDFDDSEDDDGFDDDQDLTLEGGSIGSEKGKGFTDIKVLVTPVRPGIDSSQMPSPLDDSPLAMRSRLSSKDKKSGNLLPSFEATRTVTEERRDLRYVKADYLETTTELSSENTAKPETRSRSKSCNYLGPVSLPKGSRSSAPTPADGTPTTRARATNRTPNTEPTGKPYSLRGKNGRFISAKNYELEKAFEAMEVARFERKKEQPTITDLLQRSSTSIDEGDATLVEAGVPGSQDPLGNGYEVEQKDPEGGT
ncbi:hypothetical protein GMORB2_4586 [Geosmithia morbida]|uniref:Uncharacterized protein n=1 Tax=Geosmithia morbida TaxID=1094350 RepID=A0A9P4YPZ5_9HYPO|nr:uncharacterized protein GMORB2_4586 [Geosmithia morbida]KAF4119677.1 hypothetical protein GMORB2_4586 [Geosmithia morbida]